MREKECETAEIEMSSGWSKEDREIPLAAAGKYPKVSFILVGFGEFMSTRARRSPQPKRRLREPQAMEDSLAIVRSGNVIPKKGIGLSIRSASRLGCLFAVVFAVIGATDLQAQIFAPEPVQWQDNVKTLYTLPGPQGSTLTRNAATSATPAWDGDAISTKWIYGDGWVEFRFDQTSGKSMSVGLVEVNSDRHWNTFPYCFKVASGEVGCFENGNPVGPAATTFAATDVFRIERVGTTIYFKKNGTTLHPSTTPSQGILFVDTSFVHQSGSISNCRYFGWEQPDDLLWYNDFYTPANYTTGGKGSKVSKNVASGFYDFDTQSSKCIIGDGWFRFRFGQTNMKLAAGLATANPNADYTSINYAFHAENAALSIQEFGVTVATTTYTVNDVFSIRRVGSQISYAKNDSVIYTSSTPCTNPLFVDTSFYSNGAAITNCQISGYPLSEVPSFACTSVSQTFRPTGTQLSSTAAGGGATTWAMIPANVGIGTLSNGSLGFNFGQSSGKSVEVGLTDAGEVSPPTIASIDFGIQGRSDGQIEVLESGVSKGVFGSYAVSDRFEIRRINGVIEYLKNGVIFRSVPVQTPTLFGALAFVDSAAIVKDIVFYTGQRDLLWRRPANCTPEWYPETSGYLTRNTSAAGWTADALGTRQLIGDGYIEWSFVNSGKDAMVGLSPSDKGNGYADLQYAIYAHGSVAGDPLLVYENGTNIGTYDSFSPADTYRIRRKGTTIYYSRVYYTGAETVFRTSTIPFSGPLIVDCSLQDPSVQLTTCRISNGDGLDDSWEMVEFGNLSQSDTGNGTDYDEWDNIHEFYNGTDPNFFEYRGAPTLTILTGNNQNGPASSYFPTALRVKVTNASLTPLRNAPVDFQVVSGSGKVALQNYGTPSVSLRAFTDVNGEAYVYAYASPNLETITISATAGTPTGFAQVNFSETTNAQLTANMRLWLKADEGVTADGGSSVVTWTNFGSFGSQVTAPAAPKKPLWVPNVVAGRPAVRFDGTDDELVLPHTLSGATAAEVFVVAKALADPPAHTQRLMQFGASWGTAYPAIDGRIHDGFASTGAQRLVGNVAQDLSQWSFYNVSSQTNEWIVRLNGKPLTSSATNTVGFTTTPYMGRASIGEFFQGDIAEMIVYDRVLTASERYAVEYYLGNKYGIGLPPAPPTNLAAYPMGAGQVSLTWFRPQGTISEWFNVERKTGAGAFQSVATVRNANSWIDTTVAAGVTYSYRVRTNTYAGVSGYGNDATVLTRPSGPNVPLSNVRVWFKSDSGTNGDSTISGPISSWMDQSANARLVSQTELNSQPTLVANTLNGHPVVRFDGSLDHFILSDVMNGATAAEAFVVVKAAADPPTATRRIMQFGASWGTAYPAIDGKVYEGFASSGAQIVVGNLPTNLAQWNLYNVSSKTSDFRVRLNAIPQFSTATNTVGFTATPYVGRYGGGEYFQGDIAELVVFDRVLQPEERNLVNEYFSNKFLVPDMDADNDGLSNGDEASIGTDPHNGDTNGDGLNDGASVAAGYDPTSNDVDGDSLTTAQEWAKGTNPFDPDTDRDGVPDNLDSLPLDPAVTSATPGDTTPPTITLTNPPVGQL